MLNGSPAVCAPAFFRIDVWIWSATLYSRWYDPATSLDIISRPAGDVCDGAHLVHLKDKAVPCNLNSATRIIVRSNVFGTVLVYSCSS